MLKRSAFNAKGEYFPFASTRYYGSKRRQISWLSQKLLDLAPTSILDPMGGTGTVSHAMSMLGIPVTYGDSFSFNVEAAKGIFNQNVFDLSILDDLIESVKPCDGTISQNFQGVFFTNEENNWLDGLMLQTLPQAGLLREVLFYALVQACLKKRPYNLFHRANLYMRMADTHRTFGNLTTWQKSFPDHLKESIREALRVKASLVAPVTVSNPCDVLQHKGTFNLIYLDPPYFRKTHNAESYMRKYHFLEGLASYDTWQEKINQSSPIFEFQKKYWPSEWSSGEDVLKGIESVAQRYPNASLAVSYVADQTPSIQQIEKVLKQCRSTVHRCSTPAQTVLSNSLRRELLFTATN